MLTFSESIFNRVQVELKINDQKKGFAVANIRFDQVDQTISFSARNSRFVLREILRALRAGECGSPEYTDEQRTRIAQKIKDEGIRLGLWQELENTRNDSQINIKLEDHDLIAYKRTTP